LVFDPAQRLAECVPRVRRRGSTGKPGSAHKLEVLVALSGGVDSVALLAALAQARAQFAALRACHVHHHLSPLADRWAEFCQRVARRLRVPLAVLHVEGRPPRGASLEEWAREQRYALLAEHLRPHEVVVTAHHADDQAETVLLQLLRGAGLAGLAAMPAVATFGAGWLARPFLQTPRSDIEDYARARGLEWVEDDSNRDERLARNFVRRQVMPVLRSRWPAAATVIARSAGHLAEARDLLDERAQADLAQLAAGEGLLVSGLRKLTPARRRNALRAWLTRQGVRVPDTSRLSEIAGPLLDARIDAHPYVAWREFRVLRVGGCLELARVAAPAAAATQRRRRTVRVSWDWRRQPQCETALGTLAIERDAHGPLDLDALPALLLVRSPQPNERLRVAPHRPSQAVRTLMQTARVPAAQRALLPRVWAGRRLLAVGERWLDASIQSQESSVMRGRLTVKWPASIAQP
jgi:tRNA(Ile)-lysidine synthase